jgi:hypothetical protein
MVLFPATTTVETGGSFGSTGIRVLRPKDPNRGKEGAHDQGGDEVEEGQKVDMNAESNPAPTNRNSFKGPVAGQEGSDGNTQSSVSTRLLSRDKLTVILMSYPGSSRFALLVKILQKVVAWPFILEVLLVWNGDESKVPLVLSEAIKGINSGAAVSSGATVRLLPQEHNRIDNRWRQASNIKTEAILNMDDDVNLFEDGARCMFSLWRSSPQSIISVDVRSHFKHSDRSKGKELGPFGPWGYIARDTFSDPNTDMAKKYSIGLPRVLLTSRQHLLDYEEVWKDDASGLRDIVDRLLCDDIALNFIAANRTEGRWRRHEGNVGAGGVIYAKAHFEPYPESHSKDALTKQKGMKEKRQRCVNELADKFGMSLQPRSWHVLCSVDG